MSYVEAIVLGIIQGLTEFLPISSSGHLRIAPALFGWDDPGAAFTAVIQLGTMAAVVIFFRRELWAITRAWLADLPRAWRWVREPSSRRELEVTTDARMGWYLIAATIPIVIFGAAFADPIKTGARDLRLVATTLIVMGLVLLWADRVGSRSKRLDEIDTRDGVAIGLAQSLALVPGVSRSGATISAGLFLGLTREDAARFSFLLSVPAVVLSGIYGLTDIGTPAAAGEVVPGFGATVVATLVSFVVGYAAIAWLLRWLAHHSTLVFVVYRVALGLLLYGLLLADTIQPR